MMPGSHNNYPPQTLPYPPNRRQHDYYQYPPQQPHPYPHYQSQPIYHHQHQQQQQQHYPPQYNHQYPGQWYPAYQHQPAYAPPPRHFPPQFNQHPPHQGPVIVSSHSQPPHTFSPSTASPAALPPFNPSTSTPPAVQTQTPQPAPSTPSIASQTQETQPSPATSTTTISTYTPSPSLGSRPPIASLSSSSEPRSAFPPQLPWFSNPDEPFPTRARRRRKLRSVHPSTATLELPSRDGSEDKSAIGNSSQDVEVSSGDAIAQAKSSSKSTPSITEVPSTPKPAPAVTSADGASAASQSTPASTSSRNASRVPVPIVPATPKSTAPSAASTDAQTTAVSGNQPTEINAQIDGSAPEQTPDGQTNEPQSAPAPVRAPPKSWAELARRNAPPGTTANPAVNGAAALLTAEGRSKVSSVAEAVRSFKVADATRVSFLEPRGLVNTGNMCYMNSVLQVLVFCVPFYDFLDEVGKRAVHSFKSDTPLLDAMIMFMREFKVIDSASSVEQLKLRLKDTELEQYGDAFIPEFAYDVIKRLPRFASMQRGQQQDAEEFLGFLLEQLHDECTRVLGSLPPSSADQSEVTSPISERSAADGWLEVGAKQKASVTQTSGHVNMNSPITKMFGGQLRSEFRVPGKKPSLTYEPYQPLQLDISSPEVNNIVDALKHLTKPETIHGDFDSPRGPGTHATKQVFIETLPPVLIIHLKRFQYDNMGGAQKIWKKIGYPLDLSIPKEVFAQHKRAGLQTSGLPQYRLLSVVYHHGMNANGGHYTVDVRRQDGREWIRLDDTVIRRVRSEDVAHGGAEEDPKILAKALEQHKRDTSSASKNIYAAINGDDDDEGSEVGGWSQVAAKEKDSGLPKKWSAVANGTAKPSTGKSTPKHDNFKDNKVAYLLFYRRVS